MKIDVPPSEVRPGDFVHAFLPAAKRPGHFLSAYAEVIAVIPPDIIQLRTARHKFLYPAKRKHIHKAWRFEEEEETNKGNPL